MTAGQVNIAIFSREYERNTEYGREDEGLIVNIAIFSEYERENERKIKNIAIFFGEHERK